MGVYSILYKYLYSLENAFIVTIKIVMISILSDPYHYFLINTPMLRFCHILAYGICLEAFDITSTNHVNRVYVRVI